MNRNKNKRNITDKTIDKIIDKVIDDNHINEK